MRGRLVVALERLPQAAYVWDDDDPDVTWSDTTPERVWDAPFVGSGYSDVWCDLVELSTSAGHPDQYEGYQTGLARLRIRDPGDGRYVARTPDGRLVWFAAGRRLAVFWLDPGGVAWWIFHGAVATWRQHLDGTVDVEAFACTGDLARDVGSKWTAGTAGQLPAPRAASIMTALGALGARIRTRFDLGDATLTVPPAADVLPVDALRRVAASDGGIMFADADDTLVMRDRRWRNGRPDQTGGVPVFTDNVCDLAGSVVVWDPVSADTDLRLAATVRLENQAGLIATATAAGGSVDPTIIWTHQDTDLWTTQSEGNQLAAHQAAARSDARLALESMVIHLHDRRFDYWAQTVDRRLGDLVRWQHADTFHDPPRSELYDVGLVLTRLDHHVTPDTWTVDLGTSPAVSYTAVELWDWTLLTWDSTNPLAVWR